MYEREIEEIRTLLKDYFKGVENHWKVDKWLTTNNYHFGGCAPMALITAGRAWKVRKFIESARDENGW